MFVLYSIQGGREEASGFTLQSTYRNSGSIEVNDPMPQMNTSRVLEVHDSPKILL